MSVTRALAERTAVSYDDLRRGLERVVDLIGLEILAGQDGITERNT
jgi:hypothetical protein